jgi:hypothetical protein
MFVSRPALLVSILALGLAAGGAVQAQSASAPGTGKKAPAKAAAKPAAKGTAPAKSSKTAKAKTPPPEPEVTVPDAPKEQISAAEKVFYGIYACEFSQSINVAASPKHFGYVELKMVKDDWLMKPVLSSTGAIRLEDVRGETLAVQIMSKTMLLNVKTGHRIVDDCISAKQRELMDAAKAARAAEAASAAAAASTATPTTTATAPAPLIAASQPQ